MKYDHLRRKREKFLELMEPITQKIRAKERMPKDTLLRYIRQVSSRPKFLIPILAKLGILRYIPIDITGKLFWGRKLILPLHGFSSYSIYGYGLLPGRPEENLTKFFIKNLRSDDIFYDIGASYGFYTFLAREFIQGGEIHFFEPIPEVYAYVVQNCMDAHNIFPCNKALYNKTGQVSFFESMVDSGSSTTVEYVIKRWVEKWGSGVKKTIKTYEVPTTTLDEYLMDHPSPTVVKIDVEFAEDKVIEGGKNFFQWHAPIIAMEVQSAAIHNIPSRNAVAKLVDMGYKPYRIDNNGDLLHADTIDTIELNDIANDNIIFKKD